MRSRPLPVTVAAVIQALFSLVSLPGPFLPGSEGVPDVVLYSGIVLGVAGLVASAGLWLTVVVNVLGGLSAAPGVGAAPNAGLQVAAIAGVLISALVIVLVVLPSSRRALGPLDRPSRVR